MSSRNQTLRLRISPEWAEQIEKRCEAEGIESRPGMTGGMSLWARMIIAKELELSAVDEHEILRQKLKGKKFKRK